MSQSNEFGLKANFWRGAARPSGRE